MWRSVHASYIPAKKYVYIILSYGMEVEKVVRVDSIIRLVRVDSEIKRYEIALSFLLVHKYSSPRKEICQ